MPLIATAGDSKNYTPAPEGTHQGVCVDVIDLGMKPNPYKEGALQRKVDIAWQINESRDDGKRFVVSKRYTLSLNEKATLRHDLESWRGKPFTREEEMGFDVETVIGVNALINVIHKAGTKDATKVFANVVSISPLIKGMPKIANNGYVRPTAEQAASEPVEQEHEHEEPPPATQELTDDDIPF